MHPIRLAVIPTRVKYNATGQAADVRWAWKTVQREVLQYCDGQGNWHDVPREELPLDDSAEQAESLAKTRARAEGEARSREQLAALRRLAAEGAGWTAPLERRHYGFLLDAERAVTGRTDNEGFTYYTANGREVARYRAGLQELSVTAYADWLDPEVWERRMLADFRRRLKA